MDEKWIRIIFIVWLISGMGIFAYLTLSNPWKESWECVQYDYNPVFVDKCCVFYDQSSNKALCYNETSNMDVAINNKIIEDNVCSEIQRYSDICIKQINVRELK